MPSKSKAGSKGKGSKASNFPPRGSKSKDKDMDKTKGKTKSKSKIKSKSKK